MVQSKNVRVATESYVDSKVSLSGGSTATTPSSFPGVVAPPIGMYLTIPGITSYGGEELIDKRVRFVPIWVPRIMTIDAFKIRIINALAGATANYSLRLYKTTTDGMPDCASGALASATVDVSSSGSNSGTDYLMNPEVTLQPGLYWLADYYKVNGTPSSVPSMMSYKEITIAMPTAGSMDINLRGKSYFIENQDGYPSTNSYILDLNTNNSNPYIILRRKA